MKHNAWILFALVLFSKIVLGEVGVTATSILIGTSTNLSGPAPERPTALLDGAKLFFQKVNDGGGVQGRKIELKVTDDSYDPQKTFANVQGLIENDKVFSIFQVFGSANNRAIIPIIGKNKIYNFFPGDGSETVRNPTVPQIFNLRPGFFQEANAIINYLIKKNITEIGVFYQDDAYGQAGKAGTQKAATAKNVKIVAEGKYDRATTEIGNVVDEFVKAKPKAILLWSTDETAIALMNAAKQKKYKTIFAGVSRISTSKFTDGVKDLGFEVIMASPLPATTNSEVPIVKSYLQEAKKSNLKSSNSSLEGFMNASLFVEGLKLSGGDLTREKLKATFEKMADYDLGGMKVSFSPGSHQGYFKVNIATLSGGKFLEVK